MHEIRPTPCHQTPESARIEGSSITPGRRDKRVLVCHQYCKNIFSLAHKNSLHLGVLWCFFIYWFCIATMQNDKINARRLARKFGSQQQDPNASIWRYLVAGLRGADLVLSIQQFCSIWMAAMFWSFCCVKLTLLCFTLLLNCQKICSHIFIFTRQPFMSNTAHQPTKMAAYTWLKILSVAFNLASHCCYSWWIAGLRCRSADLIWIVAWSFITWCHISHTHACAGEFRCSKTAEPAVEPAVVRRQMNCGHRRLHCVSAMSYHS